MKKSTDDKDKETPPTANNPNLFWNEQSEENVIEQRLILEPNQIRGRFQVLELLGGGGKGLIFKVFDKKDNIEKAYKVKDEGIRFGLEQVLNTLIDKSYTPHLIHLEGSFSSNSYCVWSGAPFSSMKPSRLLKEYPEYALVRPHINKTELDNLDPKLKDDIYPYGIENQTKQEVTLMEVVEENLDKTGYTLPQKVQMMSIRNILLNCGIQVTDQKPKNVFFKTLTAEDKFNGKVLLDHDYWHYRLNGEDFYIPKQERIIKLGDYDGWTLKCENDLKITESEMDSLLSCCHGITSSAVFEYDFMKKGELEQIRTQFSQRPDSDSILDMMGAFDQNNLKEENTEQESVAHRINQK